MVLVFQFTYCTRQFEEFKGILQIEAFQALSPFAFAYWVASSVPSPSRTIKFTSKCTCCQVCFWSVLGISRRVFIEARFYISRVFYFLSDAVAIETSIILFHSSPWAISSPFFHRAVNRAINNIGKFFATRKIRCLNHHRLVGWENCSFHPLSQF